MLGNSERQHGPTDYKNLLEDNSHIISMYATNQPGNEGLTDYMKDYFTSSELPENDIDQLLKKARKETVSKAFGFEPIIDPNSSLYQMTDE